MTGIQERRRALTKGGRTRERLLRAGVDRFGTDGYRATSVSQLSRDAGLTPAAAYAYFADKEAYWQAAVGADLEALRAEIAVQVMHSERPVVDAMMAMFEGLQAHPLARRVLVEGSPRDLLMVLSHPLFTNMLTLIKDVLDARQAAGTLPVHATAEQLANGIETVMFSLVLSVVRVGIEDEFDRLDGVVALVYAAAGGPPTPAERRR